MRFTRTTFRSVLAIATLAMMTTACGHRGPLKTNDAVGAMFESLARHEKLDEPVVFADPAGPIAIDIDSFAGDVLIHTDPKRTNVTVQVGREARHGSQRKKDAKSSVGDIDYVIDMIAGDVGNVLRIRTSTTHAEPQYQRANLLIAAPAVDGLRIRTSYGLIEVFDIEGAIDIESHKSDVRITTEKPLVKPVTIVNRDGDIDLRLMEGTTGSIDAVTINGKVHHKLEDGRLAILRGTNDHALMADLNSGDNPIVLRNVDGDIIMSVTDNPNAFGLRFFD